MVDAFKAAVSYGRDYDRLVELANFCAGISVSVGMTMEWCNAIQELCYPSASSDDWKELIQDIDVSTGKYRRNSYSLAQNLIQNFD